MNGKIPEENHLSKPLQQINFESFFLRDSSSWIYNHFYDVIKTWRNVSTSQMKAE